MQGIYCDDVYNNGNQSIKYVAKINFKKNI